MHDLWLTAIAPILWGTTYLITTQFLPSDHPLLTAVARALPVGIAITLLCKTYPRGRWWWRVLVLGTLNIGFFFALLFVAAYRLPGGVAATVGGVQPLIVIFLSWLLLNEQPASFTIGTMGVGIVGVALLVLDPSARLDPVGVFAAVGATVSMASGIVLAKYWGSPVSPLPFTAWQLVAGGLVLLPIALTFETMPTLSLTNMGGYVWLGIVNTGLAYALWFRGIKRLKPFQVSMLGLLSPLVAALMGYLFLAQGFGPRQWMGIGLILSSIILTQYMSLHRAAPKSALHTAPAHR